MVELVPFGPYHYKYSQKDLILVEYLKTSSGLEGTWLMRQVLLFTFVGVCGLVCWWKLFPVTTKTLPWDKVRASTCIVVTYVQRTNDAHFFSCIGFQRVQNSAIPELETCGQSHDVSLLSCPQCPIKYQQ